MTVRKYEYRDLSKGAPAAPSEARPYEEPRFAAHADLAAADAIHKKKADGFRLDRTVLDQLGMDEREKREQEAGVRKEIERRWEQAAEKAEVAGYTRGLEEGKGEAYKAELPRIAERLERLDAMLQELDSFRDRIFHANEAFLMDLIAEVAGTIVLKEVEVDKDYVRRLVTGLLRQLGTKDETKILLSEADYANVGALREAIGKELGSLQSTTIEASADIPAGGCRIETQFGVVDTSIAAQIENVKKALKS